MRLIYQKAACLPRLQEELLAAVPALQPVGGRAVLIVMGTDKETILHVPDTITEADRAKIDQVVACHDPTPPPPPPDPDEALAQAIEQATSLEELKAALIGRVVQARAKAEPVDAQT